MRCVSNCILFSKKWCLIQDKLFLFGSKGYVYQLNVIMFFLLRSNDLPQPDRLFGLRVKLKAQQGVRYKAKIVTIFSS